MQWLGREGTVCGGLTYHFSRHLSAYKLSFPNHYSSLINSAKLSRLDRRRKAERFLNLLSQGESL